MAQMSNHCVLCGGGVDSAIEWVSGVCNACNKVWDDDSSSDDSQYQSEEPRTTGRNEDICISGSTGSPTKCESCAEDTPNSVVRLDVRRDKREPMACKSCYECLW